MKLSPKKQIIRTWEHLQRFPQCPKCKGVRFKTYDKQLQQFKCRKCGQLIQGGNSDVTI